jgi:hypothetical protein
MAVLCVSQQGTGELKNTQKLFGEINVKNFLPKS